MPKSSHLPHLIWLSRLNKLLGNVVISQGGVVPHINPEVCFYFLSQATLLLTRRFPASSQQVSKGQEGVAEGRRGGSAIRGRVASGQRVCALPYQVALNVD